MFRQNVISSISQWLLQHPRLILGTAAGGLLTYHLVKDIISRPANLPPGPRPLPFIGSRHLLDFSKLYDDFTELSKKYGDVFTVYIFSTPFIILNGHAAIKEGFYDDRTLMAGRLTEDEALDDEVFMVTYSDEWKAAKKYGITGIKQYGGKQSAMPDVIMKEIEYLVDTYMTARTIPVDPTESLKKVTGNVTSAMLYGIHYEDHDHPELMEYVERATKWFDFCEKPLPYSYFYPEWLTAIMFRTELEGYCKACVDLRKFNLKMLDKIENTRDANNPRSFVEYFLSTRTLDQLGGRERFADTIGVYSLDSIDGIAKIVRWALLYLAYFPDDQNKLQQLTDKVVGCGQRIVIKDQTELGLVESFISEVYRHTSMSFQTPAHSVTRDNATFRGYNIPRNVAVHPNFQSANMDPAVYSDPETFQLDRFIDTDGQFHKPATLTQFGLGARACPGEPLTTLETFLLVSNLLHFFNISFPCDRPKPTLKFGTAGQFRQPYAFDVVFEKRESSE